MCLRSTPAPGLVNLLVVQAACTASIHACTFVAISQCATCKLSAVASERLLNTTAWTHRKHAVCFQAQELEERRKRRAEMAARLAAQPAQPADQGAAAPDSNNHGVATTAMAALASPNHQGATDAQPTSERGVSANGAAPAEAGGAERAATELRSQQGRSNAGSVERSGDEAVEITSDDDAMPRIDAAFRPVIASVRPVVLCNALHLRPALVTAMHTQS